MHDSKIPAIMALPKVSDDRTMYVLHYAPDNASLIIRLVLEAAHLPYSTWLVDRRKNDQKSENYRKLNPTGLIPTLETPEGPMSETAAILLWLGDTHGLIPTIGDTKRQILLRWLIFISNTPHAELRSIFYPDRYVPEEAITAHHQMGTNRMLTHFKILNDVIGAEPWLASPDGLIAPYLCALMRWSVLYPRGQTQWFNIHDFPRLLAMAEVLEATPHAQNVARAEGLGAKPFTAPTPPSPPEGAAI